MNQDSAINEANDPLAGPFLSPGNVNIIGFSLTGFGDTTSFGRLLKGRLRERGRMDIVRNISYGGLSVGPTPGVIGTAMTSVERRASDVVALELAISFFSLHKRTGEGPGEA